MFKELKENTSKELKENTVLMNDEQDIQLKQGKLQKRIKWKP